MAFYLVLTLVLTFFENPWSILRHIKSDRELHEGLLLNSFMTEVPII